MPLTESDLNSLRFFAMDRGDPTRWCYWEEKLPEIQRELPGFVKAWNDYVAAQDVFYRVAKSLPDPFN